MRSNYIFENLIAFFLPALLNKVLHISSMPTVFLDSFTTKKVSLKEIK